jgi:pimeloyl-ACP methyl ester carboxylesterase
MPVSDGVYYLESGREYQRFPPVLLIHGEGGSSTSWPADVRRLKGYRTIAVDLPGHGRSDGTALQSIKAYCEQVCHFLESLKITRVIVVGHSMGGAVALMMATRRSRVVAGLGMISSGAFLGGETEILEQLSTPFGFTRGLHLIQQKAFGSRATPGLIKNVMQTLEKNRHGVLFSDWCASAAFDLRAEIERIEVPVWVAVGTEDQITPRTYSQYIFDQVTNASFQTIERGGHMVLHEAGEEVALGLRAFLERIDFSGQLPDQRDTYTSSDSQGRPRNQFSLL